MIKGRVGITGFKHFEDFRPEHYQYRKYTRCHALHISDRYKQMNFLILTQEIQI